MRSEKIEQLKEALKADNEHKRAIKEYIIWQLSAMANEALAETTADELINGVFDMNGAVKAVSDLAQGNGSCVSDQAGYAAIRKYLHIDGIVTDAEAALFFLRDIPKNVILDFIKKIKCDDPAVTKPMLELDLDDLFG